MPLIILGVSCEILLRKIPNDYLAKRLYLDKNSDEVQVLILGTSHSFYGIDPSLLKLRGYNAAYVNQTLDYDWGILNKYKNHWHDLKFIILPIDAQTLFIQLATQDEEWRVKNYNIYYGIHDSYTLADNSEVFGNNFKVNKYKLQQYYLDHVSPITISALGWGESYKFTIHNNLDSTGITAAQRHNVASRALFNQNVGILKSILEYAKANHVAVIFYRSPGYKSYVDHLNVDQLNQSNNEMISLTKEYKNTVYYDYLRDTAFVAQDYYDADHVNELGAKKITDRMNSIISDLSR